MYDIVAQRRHGTSTINASAAIDGRRDIDLWYPRLAMAEDKFRSYHKAISNAGDYRDSSVLFLFHFARYNISREHASC